MTWRTLLLGEGPLALALLQGLSQSPEFALVGVFRWASHPKGRCLAWSPENRVLAQAVRRLGVADIACPGANHPRFARWVERLQPDLILVGSWGERLGSQWTAHPTVRVVNCHPSLLPAHRGANPYAAVLLAGEAETGVSFHQVTPGLDTGPLWLQVPVPIQGGETGGSLRDRCAQVARDCLPELAARLSLPDPPTPQEEARASWDRGLTLPDGAIDWSDDPAQVLRRVQALQPWLNAYTVGTTWLGPMLLSFSQCQLVPSPQGLAVPGGTVLGWSDERRLKVASRDPMVQYHLGGMRLFTVVQYLPNWLSVRSLAWLLPVGSRLIRPKI